jgi:hypothetical protein
LILLIMSWWFRWDIRISVLNAISVLDIKYALWWIVVKFVLKCVKMDVNSYCEKKLILHWVNLVKLVKKKSFYTKLTCGNRVNLHEFTCICEFIFFYYNLWIIFKGPSFFFTLIFLLICQNKQLSPTFITSIFN